MVLIAAVVLVSCGDGSDESDGGVEEPLGNGSYPVADLSIDISHPQRSVTYRVSCQGDTATITGDAPDLDAAVACAALADPDIVELLTNGPPADRVCTEIYGGPDVARLTGTLGGSEVDATIDRSNGCGINDWDVALAGLLPPALGVTDPEEPESSGEAAPAGEVVRLWVLPEEVDCVGEGPQKCLQVTRSEDGPVELFYDQIQGFDFVEGTTYVIDVEVTDVENPPADASSLAYRLVEIVDEF